MNIEIYPLEKVVINGVSIYLGMEQSAVENAIGQGELVGNRFYYYDSEMAIDYDKNKKVEFIEFLGGIDGKLQPVIYSVSAFQTKAEDIFNILFEQNHGDIDDNENGYSYSFLNINVGVYRSSIPEDVQEMIEEAAEDGVPIDEEELEYEMKKANYWETIGIGIENYYR